LSKTKHRILDGNLIEHIERLPEKEQSNWLFLGPHPRFDGRWYVDALDQSFFFDFEEMIGRYRSVSPAGLQEFLDRADELGYEVAFEEEPEKILDVWENLRQPPEFSLNSDMPKTINGLLPFQLQGFNFLRRPEIKGGLALWSTGTGKTALETALIKQHVEIDKEYNFVLVVVKSNNKVDTQRKLFSLGGIDAIVIDGVPDKRAEIYNLIWNVLKMGEPVVAITNYEKFREDEGEFKNLVDGQNVLAFFDEMPTKLRNRETQVYESVCNVLYKPGPKAKRSKPNWDRLRPNKFRSYQLTATPIENEPADQLNCIRLQDPDVFPTITSWEKKFVATRNFLSKKPETYKDLDEMGLMLEFMTHQVDKNDPDIAEMFPDVIEEPIYIDWSAKDRAAYDKLQSIAMDLDKAAKDGGDGKRLNAFQLIGVLQMLCDAPSMVQKSADNRVEFEDLLNSYSEDELDDLGSNIVTGSEAALMLLEDLKTPLTDEHSEKLKKLRELLTEKHPDEKALVFTTFSSYIFPILEKALDEWGVTYTTFRGTDKQRQAAKDKFRNDPDIQIFLSSDAGSDSIDLPEASVVIHFDLPWKWSTLVQRQNRAHRVNSKHKLVRYYTLLMANSVEDRKVEIISRKLGFHEGIFKGVISEEAISSRMSASDLKYILTGEEA
jgi:SNF2 family DNA or RNA helicase